MKTRICLAAAILAATFCTSASFADSNVALVPRVGTRGIGGELVIKATEKVNLRGGFSTFSFSRDDRASGIDYDMDATLASGSAFLDWHPWGKSFRLSLGALYNGNEVTAENKPAQTFRIGTHTYTAEEIGNLEGDVSFNKFAPYLGVGWGNALTGDGRVKLLFDVGVFYHGTPEATLVANIPDDSPLRANPALYDQFQADLREERDEFQDDITDYKVYPVISLGLAIKF